MVGCAHARRSYVQRRPVQSLSWWVDGLFALILGFGSTRDSIGKLDHSAGWGLIGRWILIVVGAVIMIVYGWAAISKFRLRRSKS